MSDVKVNEFRFAQLIRTEQAEKAHRIQCQDEYGRRNVIENTLKGKVEDLETKLGTAKLTIKAKQLCLIELLEALQEIKVRIAFVGMPQEPKDWAKEIATIEALLMKHNVEEKEKSDAGQTTDSDA